MLLLFSVSGEDHNILILCHMGWLPNIPNINFLSRKKKQETKNLSKNISKMMLCLPCLRDNGTYLERGGTNSVRKFVTKLRHSWQRVPNLIYKDTPYVANSFIFKFCLPSPPSLPATFDVLFFLMILWIYTCQVLVP